jgi:hypothetical protein
MANDINQLRVYGSAGLFTPGPIIISYKTGEPKSTSLFDFRLFIFGLPAILTDSILQSFFPGRTRNPTSPKGRFIL